MEVRCLGFTGGVWVRLDPCAVKPNLGDIHRLRDQPSNGDTAACRTEPTNQDNANPLHPPVGHFEGSQDRSTLS